MSTPATTLPAHHPNRLSHRGPLPAQGPSRRITPDTHRTAPLTLHQFTAKSLQRQAKKANKDETAEKNKLKAALQKGNTDGARIYAQNAIRKKTEGLNLLRLASRIDAVASRVETAVTMRTVTNSMGQVVKGMDKAMESMNLERVSGRRRRRSRRRKRQSTTAR